MTENTLLKKNANTSLNSNQILYIVKNKNGALSYSSKNSRKVNEWLLYADIVVFEKKVNKMIQCHRPNSSETLWVKSKYLHKIDNIQKARKKHPVRVFISYANKDSKEEQQVEVCLSKFNLLYKVITWKNVPCGGSFESFMRTIRKQDRAISIISKDYLESLACMYEATLMVDKKLWRKLTNITSSNNSSPNTKNQPTPLFATYPREEFAAHWGKYNSDGLTNMELKRLTFVQKRLKRYTELAVDCRYISSDEFVNGTVCVHFY